MGRPIAWVAPASGDVARPGQQLGVGSVAFYAGAISLVEAEAITLD